MQVHCPKALLWSVSMNFGGDGDNVEVDEKSWATDWFNVLIQLVLTTWFAVWICSWLRAILRLIPLNQQHLERNSVPFKFDMASKEYKGIISLMHWCRTYWLQKDPKGFKSLIVRPVRLPNMFQELARVALEGFEAQYHHMFTYFHYVHSQSSSWT